MTVRICKAMMVAAALALGLWGCAQSGPTATAQSEKIRHLESKLARLETACKDAETARDKTNKQLAALQEEATQMKRTLEIQKTAIEERDALRLEIDSRTAERDALKGRCENLKSGLQTLLKQCDLVTPSSPPITAAPVASLNRS
jgi:septal ring factor EnvC (AmiA/AmiB activator)